MVATTVVAAYDDGGNGRSNAQSSSSYAMLYGPKAISVSENEDQIKMGPLKAFFFQICSHFFKILDNFILGNSVGLGCAITYFFFFFWVEEGSKSVFYDV